MNDFDILVDWLEQKGIESCIRGETDGWSDVSVYFIKDRHIFTALFYQTLDFECGELGLEKSVKRTQEFSTFQKWLN